MGEDFPPLAVKEGALASAGKKRLFLCYCRSQIFSQPFPGKGVGVMVDFASRVQVGCAQSQNIHERSCCVGERRVREKLLPLSNLCVASAEAGDLLFRVEQKGNGEFVTGYVDEGAMTVSNPVYFVPQEQSAWFLPLPAPPPGPGWEAEVTPAPPVPLSPLVQTILFPDVDPFVTVPPAQAMPNPPSTKP